jgi:hypothetical protein
LWLDVFQCPLQTQPKVDLLGGRSRSDIAGEFRDRLGGLDPCIDVPMQGGEEAAVVSRLRGDVGNIGPCPSCVCLKKVEGKFLVQIRHDFAEDCRAKSES